MTIVRAPLAWILSAFLISMVGAPAVAADWSGIKTIGVISALGDTLHHVYVGSTAFTNAETSEEVPDWKLDDLVAAEFSSQLAGSFDIRPVIYSKSDFSADTGGAHSRRDFAERIGRTKPADGSSVYDAYIIVRNIENGDFVGRTNQYLFGPGLYRHHGIFGGNMDAVFVSCDVTIVDGHTGKEIDTLVMLTPGGELLFFPGQPGQEAVKDLWDEHFTLSPDARRQVQDAFKAMLHDGIALSLRRFELVPKQ